MVNLLKSGHRHGEINNYPPNLPMYPNRAAMLAGNCENCHGTNGYSSGGIPSIGGQSRKKLIFSMNKYADDSKGSVMGKIIRGYSKDDILLLAKYFSKQK
jgi:cytochrome subunit of sulfide dehydrogenase